MQEAKFLYQSHIILHNKHRRINNLNLKLKDDDSRNKKESIKDDYLVITITALLGYQDNKHAQMNTLHLIYP